MQDEGAALGNAGMSLAIRGRPVHDAMQVQEGDDRELSEQEAAEARARDMGGSFGSLGSDGTGLGGMS